jgi:hypothetical protein
VAAVRARFDNYAIAVEQAKKRFLTYDQQELICRCALRYDEEYFYISFLSDPYRICRRSGDMERLQDGTWVDGNSFGEVMTISDWLCDSRPDRYICGRWINVVSHGHYFHSGLPEERGDRNAAYFSENAAAFRAACLALGGREMPGGDVGFCVELVDGLSIYVQLWHGDEEFAPRLRFLWDENTAKYLRYETTWYALPLLVARIRQKMATLLPVE